MDEPVNSGLERDGAAGPPRLRDLAAAAGLLTVLPLDRPPPRSAAFGHATLFFPLIGLLIGAVLAGLQRLLAIGGPPWLVALLLVGAWEAIGRAETLRVWRRTHGLGGAAVMLGILALKVAGLAAGSGVRTAALLFAPLLGRWGVVVLATGARDAAAPGRKFNPTITFREFAWTSVCTFAVVFLAAEAVGIVVVVCIAALTLALRLLGHRLLGGVSWPFLLAGAQAIETLVVLLFAWL